MIRQNDMKLLAGNTRQNISGQSEGALLFLEEK
uniref:Uncharacterized protein n=1 Tax=Rhizophora mucronata TaxID=61149 RepID=A0A2P2NRG7_RHIMU